MKRWENQSTGSLPTVFSSFLVSYVILDCNTKSKTQYEGWFLGYSMFREARAWKGFKKVWDKLCLGVKWSVLLWACLWIWNDNCISFHLRFSVTNHIFYSAPLYKSVLLESIFFCENKLHLYFWPNMTKKTLCLMNNSQTASIILKQVKTLREIVVITLNECKNNDDDDVVMSVWYPACILSETGV